MGCSQSLPGRASIPQVVEIGSGKISGRSMLVDEGRSVNVFMGIPYAKPPVGILRFQVSPKSHSSNQCEERAKLP